MICLALECSTEPRSVALARAGRLLAQIATPENAPRDTPLFGMVEDVLRQSDLPREAVEVIVLGLGPGSYTGIRSAIAAAQGWALARPVALLGVSSVEAMAIQALAAGLRGPVGIVLDAQRGEFYLAGYDLQADGPILVEPLGLSSRAEVTARAAAGWALAGPELETLGLAGTKITPAAGTLARLAVGRTGFTAPEHLEPIYLRPLAFVKTPTPVNPPGA